MKNPFTEKITFKDLAKIYLSLTFHPLGTIKFMRMMNKDLELGPIQSKINIFIGIAADIVRIAMIFVIIYYFIRNYGN